MIEGEHVRLRKIEKHDLATLHRWMNDREVMAWARFSPNHMVSLNAFEKEYEKELWGKGYGTEAVILLFGIVFDQQGWHRAELYTLAENERAIRSAKKCGFRRAGLEHESAYYEGAFHDVIEVEQLKT